MTEIIPVHALPNNFHNIHFNIIIPFPAISGLTYLCHTCPKWHSERLPWHVIFSVIPFFYFYSMTSLSTLWRICVYTHISDCLEIVNELPLLPNNTTVKHFYRNQEQCEVFTGYLSLPTWRWTGEYVTPDRAIYRVGEKYPYTDK
jgi:hypothetical protein